MERTIEFKEYELEDVEQMVELGAKMHKEGAYNFLPYSKVKTRARGNVGRRIENIFLCVNLQFHFQ